MGPEAPYWLGGARVVRIPEHELTSGYRCRLADGGRRIDPVQIGLRDPVFESEVLMSRERWRERSATLLVDDFHARVLDLADERVNGLIKIIEVVAGNGDECVDPTARFEGVEPVCRPVLGTILDLLRRSGGHSGTKRVCALPGSELLKVDAKFCVATGRDAKAHPGRFNDALGACAAADFREQLVEELNLPRAGDPRCKLADQSLCS